MSSLWIETTKDEIQTSSLIKDEKTEICVIGAGLFGLTTAYYLSKYGKKVIVIDKDKIGEKVSGNTTGKITSQHELFYNYLINNYGAVYERTNEYGIDAYMIDGIINFSFSYKPNEEKIIDGIKCSSLKDIIELKEHLNRNKDKELLKTLKRLYVKSDN